MEEKQEKEKGNFWLTVASFIVNKRKAIEILFVLAMIYSVLSINKVQVNQDITSYLPADSETRIGLSLMEEHQHRNNDDNRQHKNNIHILRK